MDRSKLDTIILINYLLILKRIVEIYFYKKLRKKYVVQISIMLILISKL